MNKVGKSQKLEWVEWVKISLARVGSIKLGAISTV